MHIDPNRLLFNTVVIQKVDESGATSTDGDTDLPPSGQSDEDGFFMTINLDEPKNTRNAQDSLKGLADDLASSRATASLGAALMELSVSFASEMRRENAQRRNLETQSIIEQLNNQAEIIKSKGTWQMVLGLASAGVSAVAGGMSLGSTGKSLAKGVGEGEQEVAKDTDKALNKSEETVANSSEETIASSKELDDAIIDGEDGIEMTDVGEWSSKEPSLDDVDGAIADGDEAVDELAPADLDDDLEEVAHKNDDATAGEQAGVLPDKEKEVLEKFTESTQLHLWAQMINQFHSSVSGGLNSASSGLTAMKESEVKTDDAIIESYRSLADSQKSLEENLKELLQKALSTQQAIADNINQTRAKILG